MQLVKTITFALFPFCLFASTLTASQLATIATDDVTLSAKLGYPDSTDARKVQKGDKVLVTDRDKTQTGKQRQYWFRIESQKTGETGWIPESAVALTIPKLPEEFAKQAEDALTAIYFIRDNKLYKHDIARSSETVVYSSPAEFNIRIFAYSEKTDSFAIVEEKSEGWFLTVRLTLFNPNTREKHQLIEKKSRDGEGIYMIKSCEFSADGHQLILQTAGWALGSVSVINTDLNSSEFSTEQTGPCNIYLGQSEDGNRLYCASAFPGDSPPEQHRDFTISELDRNKHVWETHLVKNIWLEQFSSTQKLIFGRTETAYVTAEYPSGRIINSIDKSRFISSHININKWNPQKPAILFTYPYGNDYHFEIINPTTGTIHSLLFSRQFDPIFVGWLPDGSGYIYPEGSVVKSQRLGTDYKPTNAVSIAFLPIANWFTVQEPFVECSRTNDLCLVELLYVNAGKEMNELYFYNIQDMKAVKVPLTLGEYDPRKSTQVWVRPVWR